MQQGTSKPLLHYNTQLLQKTYPTPPPAQRSDARRPSQDQNQLGSAAAVFPAREFSKKFIDGFNDSSDVLKESSQFLTSIRMGLNDAGIIMDSSGGLIWFTARGLRVLENFALMKKKSQSAVMIQALWKGYSVRKRNRARPRIPVRSNRRESLQVQHEFTQRQGKNVTRTHPNAIKLSAQQKADRRRSNRSSRGPSRLSVVSTASDLENEAESIDNRTSGDSNSLRTKESVMYIQHLGKISKAYVDMITVNFVFLMQSHTERMKLQAHKPKNQWNL